MRVVSVFLTDEHGVQVTGSVRHIDVDRFMDIAYEVRNSGERLGKFNPASRNPDLKEQRRHIAMSLNQTMSNLEEELGKLLLDAYTQGYRMARRQTEPFECTSCGRLFVRATDLAEHAEHNDDCHAELKKKLGVR